MSLKEIVKNLVKSYKPIKMIIMYLFIYNAPLEIVIKKNLNILREVRIQLFLNTSLFQ